MQLRKKILIVILACLVGFQPVARAENAHTELISAAILIVSVFSPVIVMYMIDRGYGVYRNIKHKCGFEGPSLRKAKKLFMQNLHAFDLQDQSHWRDNCYCHFFNKKNDDSEKKIESFIAGQEEYDAKKPLKLFGWTFEDVRDKEKDLFKGIDCPKDDFDRMFFVQDVCKLLAQYRKNEVDRFIGVCCAAYPCKYGIEADIKREYPNIRPSKVFNAFRSASARSNSSDMPDTKDLISKQLLFACIEQQRK